MDQNKIHAGQTGAASNMKTMRPLFLASFVVCTLLVACGDPLSRELNALWRIQDGPRRTEEFHKRSYDHQIDLYLYAMQKRPPLSGTAVYIASNGKPIIPVLLNRLRIESEESNQRHLVYVLRVMAVNEPRLKEDSNVIANVKSVISQMKSAHYRAETDQLLKAILEGGSVSPKPKK